MNYWFITNRIEAHGNDRAIGNHVRFRGCGLFVICQEFAPEDISNQPYLRTLLSSYFAHYDDVILGAIASQIISLMISLLNRLFRRR